MQKDQLVFPISEKEAKELNISNRDELNRNAAFPMRLRKLRQDANVSQQDLANAIGVTKSTISLYEKGEFVPDIKSLVKIAEFYNVSYNYLLLNCDSPQDIFIDLAAVSKLSDEETRESTYYEINQYLKKFIESADSFISLPENEKKGFEELMNNFFEALRCSWTVGSGADFIGQNAALDRFHNAVTGMTAICADLLAKAYKKKLSFYPEEKVKIRILSKTTKEGDSPVIPRRKE